MSVIRPAPLSVLLLLALSGVMQSVGPASAGPQVPSVAVVDDTGRSWQLDQLVRDRPVVLGFFFTYCARICPVQTAVMRDAREVIRSRKHGIAPLLLSVSLQPFTDTPDAIRTYASTFDIALGEQEGWLMVTGTPENLQKIWSAFGEEGRSPDEHVGRIWVGRSGGRWSPLSVFSSPSSIADAVLDRP